MAGRCAGCRTHIWGVSTPTYAIKVLGIDPAGALWAGVIANIVFVVALPVWGRLSHRIGRKPVVITAILSSLLLYFPASWFVRDAAWQLCLAMPVMLVFIAASSSVLPAVYAELFPTRIRTLGVAVPYAVSVAVFGGTAAYLQAGFIVWFGSMANAVFSAYVIVLLLVSFVTAWRMKETKGAVFTDREASQDVQDIAQPATGSLIFKN